MKIVFFGSTNLALPVLESLKREHEIAAVVTTPDAPAGRRQQPVQTAVSVLAKDLNLNLLKPEKLKNNADFLAELKNIGADIFVVAAYGKIIPDEIINLPKLKTLNVHPSLLPKYRGPSPIRTALLNGDDLTGVTLIILDEQVDHGPILAQQKLKIGLRDNDLTLTDKLAALAAEIANPIIADYGAGKLVPLPQDDSRATFTKMVSKDDGRISWDKPAAEIYNQFRAYYPWPGIWTVWDGKKIKITDCLPVEADNIRLYDAGTVTEGGVVACGQNTRLQIKTLQPEGRSGMDIKSFLNGYRNFVGAMLV